MIITRKIIEFGNSKAITLPKEISKNLNSKDTVVFDVKVIKILGKLDSDKYIKSYKCLACEYVFSQNPKIDKIYCPSCNNENMDAIEEIRE